MGTRPIPSRIAAVAATINPAAKRWVFDTAAGGAAVDRRVVTASPRLSLPAVGGHAQRGFDPRRLDRAIEDRAIVDRNRRSGDLCLHPRGLVNPHALQRDDSPDERAF